LKVSNELQKMMRLVSNGVQNGRPQKETKETKERMIRKLDEVALAFQLCRWTTDRPDGWIRAVRTAIGLPIGELAKRMGVTRWDAYRLEKSEQDGRIQVASLKRAAEAMGCELVYAMIPRVGSIGAMAARQRVEDEAAQALAREEQRNSAEWREQAREAILKSAEAHDLPLRAITR
jgi:predicted DNA-binding mobile mystery protein A